MDDLTVHAVTPDDWRSHRDLRLEMLLDAPEAFCTQHADVAALDEAAWRERVARQCHFQARLRGEPVGTVGLWVHGADDQGVPGSAGDGAEGGDLVAMYVTPGARGQGVGERLVQAVLDEAGMRRLRWVLLEVTSGNAPAIGLYERMGFAFDRRRRPHPARPELTQLGMRRRVRGPGRISEDLGETPVPPAGASVEG